jgi:Flp pilus assembly protein TadD
VRRHTVEFPRCRHLLLERGDSMARVQLGNALAQLGRLAQAEKELRGAARRDPRDPNAVFGLGEVYQLGERFQAAERAFRQVVRMCPRDAYPRIKLAEVLERLGQRDQAAAQALAVVRSEPRWRQFMRSFLH